MPKGLCSPLDLITRHPPDKPSHADDMRRFSPSKKFLGATVRIYSTKRFKRDPAALLLPLLQNNTTMISVQTASRLGITLSLPCIEQKRQNPPREVLANYCRPFQGGSVDLRLRCDRGSRR